MSFGALMLIVVMDLSMRKALLSEYNCGLTWYQQAYFYLQDEKEANLFL